MKTLDLAGVRKVNSGKVREVFEVAPDLLLIVATDRISAFDVILPNTIPNKGKVLTQISQFWFDKTKPLIPNHVVTSRVEEFPAALEPYAEQLRGRSMLARKCRPLPVECVARGYLAGSGWKEYRATGEVCGVRLPEGLREADELPTPIFTPATKAASGHDENISFEKVVEILGAETATAVRDHTLKIYESARAYARERGIIICDTKFEFGLDGDRLLLIDEALTPDSSRFWPADRYQPGGPQPSFDKQFIRDYLETLDWDKTAPGPELPAHIVEATARSYAEAYRRLTGRELEV
jgi:phosphoribosylaminoimidazole-succinocarboxamide synthase